MDKDFSHNPLDHLAFTFLAYFSARWQVKLNSFRYHKKIELPRLGSEDKWRLRRFFHKSTSSYPQTLNHPGLRIAGRVEGLTRDHNGIGPMKLCLHLSLPPLFRVALGANLSLAYFLTPCLLLVLLVTILHAPKPRS